MHLSTCGVSDLYTLSSCLMIIFCIRVVRQYAELCIETAGSRGDPDRLDSERVASASGPDPPFDASRDVFIDSAGEPKGEERARGQSVC